MNQQAQMQLHAQYPVGPYAQMVAGSCGLPPVMPTNTLQMGMAPDGSYIPGPPMMTQAHGGSYVPPPTVMPGQQVMQAHGGSYVPPPMAMAPGPPTATATPYPA